MRQPKEVSWDELLAEFDEEVHQKLKDAVHITGADAVVLLENLDMSSSNLGDKTALCVGPTCTYKTVEEVKRLGDVPSRFQYPKMWAKVPDELRAPPAQRTDNTT